MLFNSSIFLIFTSLVFILYWSCFNKNITARNLFLIIVSYIFYGWWNWRWLFLIVGCSLINWLISLELERTQRKRYKQGLLITACLLSLSALIVCKYYNFFVGSFVSACEMLGFHVHIKTLQIILPVGISFFTFQAIGYTIDVYKGKVRATRSWIDFFAFISFFPQLVAGPIERASGFLPQFRKRYVFDYEKATDGLVLIVYGLFKKMAVADNLAIYVDTVFTNFTQYSSLTLLLGAVLFSFQIYCDFSGYSDIARGIAKLFGFELMVNFDSPYFSKSISEFWRRWHISLSTWFKDYLYIPLGGNRVSTLKYIRNIWIVFLVSGLWHGANYTFIIWGALHAFYQTCGYFKARIQLSANWTMRFSLFRIKPMRYIISGAQILTVNILVVCAWIFFRADSFEHAINYFGKMLTWEGYTRLSGLGANYGILFMGVNMFLVCLLIGIDMLSRSVQYSQKRKAVFLAGMLLMIIFFGKGGDTAFIYFQF